MVRDFVLAAVSNIPLSRSKWAKRLIQIGSSCRTINGMYMHLRAIVYGAGRSAGPILEKKASYHRSCPPSEVIRKSDEVNSEYRRYGHAGRSKVAGNSDALLAEQSKAPVIDLSIDESSASGDFSTEAKSAMRVLDSDESSIRQNNIENSNLEVPRNDNIHSSILIPIQIGAPNIYLYGGYNGDAPNSLQSRILLDEVTF